MQEGSILSHFCVTRCRPIEELAATMYELEHETTGAKLIWLDRASENKTFGIAFRTIPSDDTGVFHILEHSVLCGSRRYPVKEPFVELLKSSMQTFLNAMTFPDKTFYPVCSRNDKDFMNLMRVYLDAVFFPSIYDKPEIFRQEGWHIALGEENQYKGVVFNEMKGVFASADALMSYELDRQMFPDTCYRYVSGGDPAQIPELTYEQFLQAHRTFYHPSNAYIYLDGSLCLEQILQMMDEDYLCHFRRETVHTDIPLQKPVTAARTTAYYALSPKEPLQGRAKMAWGYGLGRFDDRLENTAMSALADLLACSNQTPLCQKVLEQELAKELTVEISGGLQQIYVVVQADEVDPQDIPRLEKVIRDTLTQQIEQGIDREHLRAILANMELHGRQRDFGSTPQGLGLGEEILASWLYGGDPAQNLSVVPLFAKLNELVDTGWYEALLRRVFLENDHTCQVLLLPSHELQEQQRQAEEKQLAAAMAREELSVLQARQAALEQWQNTQDSLQALQCLPKLALSDISQLPERIPMEVQCVQGVTVLRHRLPCSGIGYWGLYFDVSDLQERELTELSLLCQMLGALDTARSTPLELQKRIDYTCGGLGFCVVPYSRTNDPLHCKTYFCVSFSALEEKLEAAVALVMEILRQTDFSDEVTIRDLLRQCRLRMEQALVTAGHSFGSLRVRAGCCAAGVVEECTGGVTFLKYLKEVEPAPEQLAPIFAELCSKAVQKQRLVVSITGEQPEAPLQALLGALPEGNKPGTCPILPWGARKEGIVIPADISFAVQGGLLPFSGSTRVAAQIVSLDHLWNSVRVQGGAYGADLIPADRGTAIFYSYRDPDAAASFGCFADAGQSLRESCEETEGLEDFIIGTISSMEGVMTSRRLGMLASAYWLRGITYEDRCAIRRQVLSTTKEDLLQQAELLEAMCRGGSTCVVGSRDQVEKCDPDIVIEI